MNLGKLIKSVVSTVKKNPQAAIIVGTLIAPKLAAKVVPVIVAATSKQEG